jgi:hypothetical protein
MGDRHPLLIMVGVDRIELLHPSQRQDTVEYAIPRFSTTTLVAQHNGRLATIRPSIRLDMKIRFMAEGVRDLTSMIGLATVPIPDLLSLVHAAPKTRLTRMNPIKVSRGFVCGRTVPGPNLQRTIAQHSSQVHSSQVHFDLV